jgi:glucan phosphoethanolaminetransferase (alkaline phosphatase superfamily)
MQAFSSRVSAAFVLLCLPYAALGVWLARTQGLRSQAAFAASVALLMWLIAFIARTWRRFFLLQFPLLLLSVAFASYTILYNHLPGQAIAYVLVTSSWDEMRGFFGIWQGQKLLLPAVIGGLIYLVLSFWSSPRPISSSGNARARWGFLGAVLLMTVYAAHSSAAFIDGIAANPAIGTAMFIAGPIQDVKGEIEGKGVHKVAYRASPVAAEEVHILVVGESARRDSWSVYGYQRATTPMLAKLRGEAIFFTNAVADANLTAYAVPMLLTGMPPGQFELSAVRGSLVDLAKEAGYSTAWLVNQDIAVSQVLGIRADQMSNPPSLAGMVAGRLPFDETLLPAFQREIERRGKARFIGLHVIGSHWQYESRYPPAFERFGSARGLSAMSAFSRQADERVVNAYDNSVAYTDWFLGQIIQQARSLPVPATVTYFSDHGEDLYTLDGQAGHGTSTYSKHQFDIPAFVWVNSAYRKAHADKVQALSNNSAKLIRSHNVFYSVADLMGIEWPGASPQQSFASARFVPDTNEPYIAGGNLVTPPH